MTRFVAVLFTAIALATFAAPAAQAAEAVCYQVHFIMPGGTGWRLEASTVVRERTSAQEALATGAACRGVPHTRTNDGYLARFPHATRLTPEHPTAEVRLSGCSPRGDLIFATKQIVLPPPKVVKVDEGDIQVRGRCGN